MEGGSVQTVLKTINSSSPKPVILNPASNFVVATYWWGRGNMNKNLQRPCPEEITDPIKEEMEEELAEEDPDFKVIYEKLASLNSIKNKRQLTKSEKDQRAAAVKAAADYTTPYFLRDDVKKQIAIRYEAILDKIKKRPGYKPMDKMENMIEKWKATCTKAKCNYIVHELSVERDDYQNAINGKAAFILKCLDACPGRGVLYIDGDMYINKYPGIFDMPNVDFMGRGWNADPRSANTKYKTDVCFDPYVFETSGGTLFFGNTPMGRDLLHKWSNAMADPVNKGKAEDRVISMIVTDTGFVKKGNIVQLPIEYLWLTDKYEGFDKKDASRSRAFIEHPACLTGEERASEQGAASNRTPNGYKEKIEDIIECTKRGGVFYEYVFFPKKKMVNAFGDYLTYMRRARNFETRRPLFNIVPFESKYGKYNLVAAKNAKNMPKVQGKGVAKLPLNPPIPHILAHLRAGNDVQIGNISPAPNAEFTATNRNKSRGAHVKIVVDVTRPMYISASNPIIQHLLRMCKTLEDINVHLTESYVFASRIRWSETGGKVSTRKTIRNRVSKAIETVRKFASVHSQQKRKTRRKTSKRKN